MFNPKELQIVRKKSLLTQKYIKILKWFTKIPNAKGYTRKTK